jgi:hypothetical protein
MQGANKQSSDFRPLLALIVFDPEDGGNKYFRNVGELPDGSQGFSPQLNYTD